MEYDEKALRSSFAAVRRDIEEIKAKNAGIDNKLKGAFLKIREDMDFLKAEIGQIKGSKSDNGFRHFEDRLEEIDAAIREIKERKPESRDFSGKLEEIEDRLSRNFEDRLSAMREEIKYVGKAGGKGDYQDIKKELGLLQDKLAEKANANDFDDLREEVSSLSKKKGGPDFSKRFEEMDAAIEEVKEMAEAKLESFDGVSEIMKEIEKKVSRLDDAYTELEAKTGNSDIESLHDEIGSLKEQLESSVEELEEKISESSMEEVKEKKKAAKVLKAPEKPKKPKGEKGAFSKMIDFFAEE